MKTQISKIITDVENALNEVNPNEAAFVGDLDHADLLKVIESQIAPTVDEIHAKAHISRMALDATEVISYNGDATDPRFKFNNRTGVLSIITKSLDDHSDATFDVDILKMVTATARNWPFEVTNEVFPDDPLFAIVTDKYVGAQVEFPAVTRRKRKMQVDGEWISVEVLELRCLEKPTDWATVTFIPVAKMNDGCVDVDSKLYHDFICLLSAKVKEIIHE